MQFAAGEQDSLTYLATEKVLMRGNKDESVNALVNYLQSFSTGAFRLNANVELARLYVTSKEHDQALRYYDVILQAPDNKFTEEALAHKAELQFMNGDTEEALETFRTLALRAERKENKEAAKLGILRTTSALERNDDIVLAANELLENGNLSPELRNEALYNRANALIALGKSEYAAKDLEELAKDTRNIFGAEANYRLAQFYFDEGNPEKAEASVFALIESSTPHQYWLARGFILLADIYIAQNDPFRRNSICRAYKTTIRGTMKSRI